MSLFSLSLAQLLLAFVSSSILRKLALNRFFLRWLESHKFVCYLAPTNQTLKRLKSREFDEVGKKKSQSKRNRAINRAKKTIGAGQQDDKEEFKIPTSNLDCLSLETTRISVQDLELLHFSIDLEWVIDFALVALFCFIMTELQFNFYVKSRETNFSLLWALLVVLYCISTLWKLTAAYFTNQESIGERSICIVSGCVFLLIAMVVLIVNESYLELGLDKAYRSFNQSATAFVNNSTILAGEMTNRPPTRPVSYLLVKFALAVLSALIGMLFTFPGLRFGQLHRALIDGYETSYLWRIVYNFNYLTCLIVTCLWIKPISRDLMINQNSLSISNSVFDTSRNIFILSTGVFRFFLLPRYLSVFLSSGTNRVASIRRRGGTTTNREVQLSVFGIYSYISVVAIQYTLPIIMCLFTAILFMSMSGTNWLPSTMVHSNNTDATGGLLVSTSSLNLTKPSNISESLSSKFLSLRTMIDFNEFKNIFSDDVFKGILGFATWWLHFSWFCTSTAGLLYYTCFPN